MPRRLRVRLGVLAAFVELARSSGKARALPRHSRETSRFPPRARGDTSGSCPSQDVMTRKKEKIKSMLVAAQGAEAQYIVRACQGEMRLGLTSHEGATHEPRPNHE